MRRLLLGVALAGMMAMPVAADTLIDKPPDVGPWWHPLGAGTTELYASDFIAPDTDVMVQTLGTWLQTYSGGPDFAVIDFEIWGTDPSTGGPDFNNIIAKTGTMQTDVGTLTLFTMDVIEGPAMLTPGDRYWFVASAWGMGDPSYGYYQVGGHTQNSVYQDNGTFWFSNYPDDGYFDGQGYTPQMAFQVGLGPIPTPGALALLGLAGLVRRRRR